MPPGQPLPSSAEEGSFDFLQAIPVNSKQLFISKITVSIIATLVMYAVLYPLTLLFTGGKVPDVNFVQTMLAICLTAALEAIAWGTFFSLICMRPLVAICLAMLAGSTVAHVLAWRQSPSMGALDLSAYARAALAHLRVTPRPGRRCRPWPPLVESNCAS